MLTDRGNGTIGGDKLIRNVWQWSGERDGRERERDGQGMLDGEWRWEVEDGSCPLKGSEQWGGELGRDVMKPGRSL